MINDRKAPRLKKGKFSKMLINKELFSKFKKKFPEYNKMNWDEFFSLWKDISETIRNEAVTNPLGVKLGSLTGEIKVQYLGYKPKTEKPLILTPDNEIVHNSNLLTKGKIPVIKWERKWAVKFNKSLELYGFTETRELTELKYKYVKENPDKIRVSKALKSSGYGK